MILNEKKKKKNRIFKKFNENRSIDRKLMQNPFSFKYFQNFILNRND